jgi:hypothetical protein
LASHLVFVGLSSSAVSISEDIKLLKTIRKSVIKEAELLDGIGTAYREQEVQKKILRITKNQEVRMIQDTGVLPSLSFKLFGRSTGGD